MMDLRSDTVTQPTAAMRQTMMSAPLGSALGGSMRQSGVFAELKAQAVLATGLIGLRFVTHLDVDAAGVDFAIDGICRFMAQPLASQGAGSSPSGIY